MRAGIALVVLWGCGSGVEAPDPNRDEDGDGVVASADCDDHDPARGAGFDEFCDDIDHNCDGDPTAGAVDAPTWYVDADGDGFGTAAGATQQCEAPAGTVERDGDCDDANPWTHPDAVDIPGDGEDSDCDAVDDEVLDCTVIKPFVGPVTFEESDATDMRDFCSRHNTIAGSITLTDLAAERASVFDCLCTVHGDVVIEEAGALRTVDAVDVNVGGALIVRDNPSLETLTWSGDLSGLIVDNHPALGTVDLFSRTPWPLGLWMADNPALALASFRGGAELAWVHLENNGNPTSPFEFDLNLAEVSGAVVAQGNPGLDALFLGVVNEALIVEHNPVLGDVWLQNRTGLHGDFRVVDNPLLSRIRGEVFDPLAACEPARPVVVGGSVEIRDNPELTFGSLSLSGPCLEQIDGDLRVEGNATLGWTFLDAVHTVGGDLTYEEPEPRGRPGPLMPALQEVRGSLRIYGVEADEALGLLRTVGGDLDLDTVAWSLEWLATPVLTSVGGDLRVFEQFEPEDPKEFRFPVLASVGGDVDVRVSGAFEAPELATVGGDVDLNAIDGDATYSVGPADVPGNLTVTGALMQFSYLGIPHVDGEVLFAHPITDRSASLDVVAQGLTTVGGDLDVIGVVPDLAFLGGLQRVEQSLTASDAGRLTGLEQLTFADRIDIGDRVPDLVGLSSLVEVDELIVGGAELTSLNGVSSLATVNTLLWIRNNPRLTSLQGLESLQVANAVDISFNERLASLDGLQGLRTVTDSLVIAENAQLTDVSSLLGIKTIQSLYVLDNPSLATDDAQALADALPVTGVVQIQGNAP